MGTKTNMTEAEHLAAWNRDGFLIIPDILTANECEHLQTESLAILQDHARPGASVYVGCAAVHPDFARLAEHPKIVAVLRNLLPEGIEFLSDKLVYKKPGKSFATPWHIDAWYWRNTRPKLSVWIPFGDTSADGGTLTVLPGSHLREWTAQKTAGVNGGEFSDSVDESELPGDSIRICEIAAGTAIIFSDRLVHGSTAAEGAKERYAIISTYHAPGEEPFDANFPARKVIV
ncbi:MAG TPA: phytanoyl-CoA dioxygenase family protein [Terrimicrobiaceae bacterium]|nr:phytanoyl-CoA dioxygenase family protein [Terrimicrobiaceae bacterium]